MLFCLLVFVTTPFHPAHGEQTGAIQRDDVIVFFEHPLEPAAKTLLDIYPAVRGEIEEVLEWKLDFRPTVILVDGRKKFEQMAGSPWTVAFAVPEKRLIVIDYSKMNTRPFTLRVTLKHELSHLLLHHYIQRAHLPKWIDEGVSQWVSDGIAELIIDTKRSGLKEATLSGNYIPIDALTERFPLEKKSVLLAYEQSKSLIEYMDREFGRDRILGVLENLRNGEEVQVAIGKGLSLSLEELEGRWHAHLRKRTTWFTYLTRNLYGILFFLMAVITVYAFVRVLRKRKAYRDQEDDGALP
jgi:hypothetical protein